MATKQKSGLYRARLKIGVDEHGKDIYKYISGRTKKELEAARQKAIAYYIDGTGLEDDTLFGPYAVQWYKTYKAPEIRPGTQAIYRSALNRHILPAFGDRRLRSIRVSDLQAFFNRFADHPSLTMRAKAIFNGVFDAACADRILDRNPMALVKILRPPTKAQPADGPDKHRILTPEERQRVVDLCAKDPGALYIALLYYLGVRSGEAAGLRWGDIDWARGVVHVQRTIDDHARCEDGLPKTKASDRIVPLPPPLAALLSSHRGMPGMYILHTKAGRPLSAYRRQVIWRAKVIKACQIPGITAHALRHNYVTMCWEAGIDVYATARFVGHASVSITMRVYTHLSQEREEQSMQAVRRLFG